MSPRLIVPRHEILILISAVYWESILVSSNECPCNENQISQNDKADVAHVSGPRAAPISRGGKAGKKRIPGWARACAGGIIGGRCLNPQIHPAMWSPSCTRMATLAVVALFLSLSVAEDVGLVEELHAAPKGALCLLRHHYAS